MKYGDAVLFSKNQLVLNGIVFLSKGEKENELLTIIYLDPARATAGPQAVDAVATAFGVPPLKPHGNFGWAVPDAEIVVPTIADQQSLQQQAADLQAKADDLKKTADEAQSKANDLQKVADAAKVEDKPAAQAEVVVAQSDADAAKVAADAAQADANEAKKRADVVNVALKHLDALNDSRMVHEIVTYADGTSASGTHPASNPLPVVSPSGSPELSRTVQTVQAGVVAAAPVPAEAAQAKADAATSPTAEILKSLDSAKQ